MPEGSQPGVAQPTAARRRYITILFSDLSESTRIAAALEAEHYADMLVALRHAAEEVVAKHGGTIARIQGDGVLAIFGYPAAREDDGRRATEAALDLHQRVRGIRLETRLPWRDALGMHSGIHAGLVLVDDGDLVRGRFELIGDPPNIAARLSDAAKDGEIVVSEETLGPETHFFQTDGPHLLRLAGRADPLAVHRVIARAGTSSRFEARARRGLAPFVGRQSELRVLEGALHEVMAGKPGRVTLVASAGVGKTRLAEEFLRRARALDCEVFRGYCESYLGAEPLQPFLQMLKSLFGIERGTSPPAAELLLEEQLHRIDPGLLAHRTALLQALSLNPQATAGDARRAAPEKTINALRDLFARLAENKPLVLFIDDLQWADDATHLVVGAIQGIGDRAILEFTATRGFEAGDASLSDANVIELAPFSEEEAEETIERLLPGIDPFVAAEIRRDSGGNPLFLEELCHSASQETGGRRLGHAAGSAAWLDTLIESRVARLPDAQAELVRTAAVIGNVIPAWLLEQLTGCGEKHPLVQALAARDFIFPGEGAGTLRFKHGIARDAIYAAVGLRERRALHARIAEALRAEGAAGAREDAYESLAYHYRSAGNSAEAAHYAELAGDKAVAASALDRAQAQFRAALDAIDQLEPSRENYQRWNSIAHRLAGACVFDPSRDQLDVFRRAVGLAVAHDDPAAAATAEFWLGYINYALGESRTAIDHFERAKAKAGGLNDGPLAAQLRATLGQAKAAACDYDAALELFDQALAIKRQHRSTSRPSVGSAYTLACKAAVLGDRGLFNQAYACLDEAMEAVRGARHVVEGSVLCLQSSVLLWQGRWEDARVSAAAAQQVAERVKSLYFFAMSRSLGAYADWVMTRAPASLQTIADATSWLEARDRGLFISLNHGWLTDAMVASHQFAGARVHAARALMRARKGDRIGESMAWRAMARAAAWGHDRKPAQRYLDLAMRAAQARGSPHEVAVTQLCAAEIALARNARSEAAALLDQAGTAFETMAMAWHLDKAARLRRGIQAAL